MTLAAIEHPTDYLRALPGDDVRQIQWRFADRFDLQMLVQSVRAVARGPVARLVASGARNTHEWTPDKQALLKSFDESGITGVFMDPAQGGFIEGPMTSRTTYRRRRERESGDPPAGGSRLWRKPVYGCATQMKQAARVAG